MFGTLAERLCRGTSEWAADARRTLASTHTYRAELPFGWVGSRCRIRTRRAAEPAFRGSRVARDAAPTPAVVTDRSAPDSLLSDGPGDDILLTALVPLEPLGDGADELSQEQLESRRLSSQAASTSSGSSFSTSSLDEGTLALRRPAQVRSPATAFPTFPWPAASTAGTTGPPASPFPQTQIPPEAAQLYAGSATAGNLSATSSNVDVLTPLLDSFRLEAPARSAPGGSASNVQRVYRTATAAAAGSPGSSGGGGDDTAAADGNIAASATTTPGKPRQVRRKRARTRVLDSSELLLARDEAVRTELISRVWNDLLRFEERLSTAAAAPAGRHDAASAQQGQAASIPAAAAAPDSVPTPASLEDVLSFLQHAAAADRGERAAEETAAAAAQRRAAERSSRLMGYIARADTWQRLARLFLKHGRAFSVAHLVAAVVGLARFDAADLVPRCRDERKAFELVWDMLTRRAAYAAPRMTGAQVVQVVRAIGSLPLRSSHQAERLLTAVQRQLRYSQHIMQQQQQGAAGAAANRVAVQQREGKGNGKGATAAVVTSVKRLRGRTGVAVADLDADAAGPVALTGADYAALCYTLGRINSAARPWRLSLRLSPLLTRRLLRGSYGQLSELGPRELAGLLYGLGCMRLRPPTPWIYGYYVCSARSLSAMTDVELTMVMYGACRLKNKPPPQWIESYLAATGPRLRQFDGTGLAAAVHSLGRLKYKPRPVWVEAFMSAAHAALAAGAMQPPEMSQLARGLMFLGLRPPADLLEALWEASGSAMDGGEFSAAQLVNVAWALGLLKVPTPRRWYEQLLLQVRKSHLSLRPYHRRRALVALHAFGCRDLPRWYQLLRIPLEEMPGYEAWLAQQSELRAAAAATQSSKAAKVASPQQKQKQQPAQQLKQEQAVKQSGGAARAVTMGVKAAAAPRPPTAAATSTVRTKRKRKNGAGLEAAAAEQRSAGSRPRTPKS